MRALLINVPPPSIGSRIPNDHLPPLGLLCVGEPLIDEGHEVRLIDSEFTPDALDDIVLQAESYRPDAVMFGHSGSTSGHPVIAKASLAIARALPEAAIVYGGVYPTLPGGRCSRRSRTSRPSSKMKEKRRHGTS